MLYKAKELLHRSMYMGESVCVCSHMPRYLVTVVEFSPFNLEKGVEDQLISR